MKKLPVESTSLAAVGYNGQTKTLEVEFQNARVYQYRGVAPVVFEELKAAESKGRYFNANIKGRYPYARIG